MTFAERVTALRPYGFTDRQAQFLVTVMLHSGVCLVRQYCAFSHIVRGQKTANRTIATASPFRWGPLSNGSCSWTR
jgi:hypothetical protein